MQVVDEDVLHVEEKEVAQHVQQHGVEHVGVGIGGEKSVDEGREGAVRRRRRGEEHEEHGEREDEGAHGNKATRRSHTQKSLIVHRSCSSYYNGLTSPGTRPPYADTHQ